MTTALIGHTGFVGSNIARQHRFDDVYNSADIGQIAGRSYDLVVSAANGADSHRINLDPSADLANIQRFADVVGSVRIERLVLISTVCVYPAIEWCDEDTPMLPDELTPYGRHRLALERILASRHDTLTVRLPQLFGPGIKKGVAFDLLHRHRLEHIDPDGVLQHYDLARLWHDIEIGLAADLSALNLATQPMTNRRVAEGVFDIDLDGVVPPDGRRPQPSPFAAMYTRNMATKHSLLFGRDDGYVMSAADEMVALRRFRDESLISTGRPS